MFFSPLLEDIPYLVDDVPCKTCTIAIHQEEHGVDSGAHIDDELRRRRNTCGLDARLSEYQAFLYSETIMEANRAIRLYIFC